jgi:hypothetical protein
MSEPARPVGKIRDRGYVPYQGAHTPETTRWAVVARRMLRQWVRRPGVIVCLVLAVFPALVAGVAMYIEGRVEAAVGRTVSIDHYVYTVLMRPYGTFLIAVLMAMFAGAGAVADDVRAGAFQFYFARPLTRDQYLAGKLVPAVALVALISLVPSVCVALLRVALAASAAEAARALFLPLRALVVGALVALALGAPAVALSSLGGRRTYLQGGFAALVFLPWLVGAKFADFTRTPWPMLPSLAAHLQTVARFVFDMPPEPGERMLPAWLSLVALTAMIAGSVALARRRLASVEVIAS